MPSIIMHTLGRTISWTLCVLCTIIMRSLVLTFAFLVDGLRLIQHGLKKLETDADYPPNVTRDLVSMGNIAIAAGGVKIPLARLIAGSQACPGPRQATLTPTTSQVNPRASSSAKRRQILEKARDSIGGGSPSTLFPVISSLANKEDLPFVSCKITVYGQSDPALEKTFDDVLCLFDTGATVSTFALELLGDRFRNEVSDKDNGDFLTMDIMFKGSKMPLTCPLAVKSIENIPNRSDFFILGQKFFLENMEYQITPNQIENREKKNSEATFGSLWYVDPVDGVVPFE